MKLRSINILTLAILACAGVPLANSQDRGANGPYDSGHTSYQRNDTAQVVRVNRLNNYYSSYQRHQCWNEQINNYEDGYYRDRSGQLYRGNENYNTRGAVIGGLVGGAIGNQVGKGDGRTAATVAGVVIGASIGSQTGNYNDRNDVYEYRDERGSMRRCRPIGEYSNYGGQGGDAYQVTYRYAGKNYSTILRQHPGRYMQVAVEVRPMDPSIASRR